MFHQYYRFNAFVTVNPDIEQFYSRAKLMNMS